MITKEIIDQIEGEASIYFDMQDGKVDFADIVFPHFRGMENILQGKNALDALLITPRVCGICGHSHLMAAVRAIEDAYGNSGQIVKLTQKAHNIRELTLTLEIIQNHFKWIYMVLIPKLNSLNNNALQETPLKGAYAASLATKAMSVLSGQWPHSSYMVPGGVTCDPTYIEIMQAKASIEKLIAFFERESLNISLKDFLRFESCKELNELFSDISKIEEQLIMLNMHQKGFSYDTFIVLGEHAFSKKAKIKMTRVTGVDVNHVSTEEPFILNERSYAENALYKNIFHETGPMARLMSKNIKFIKNMHRRYKDSAYTRVMARIYETGYLLEHALNLVSSIDVTQKSIIPLNGIDKVTARGIGVVEAPRGPLIHKIVLQDGIIENYKIITPTQWNISSGPRSKLSPAQKAMSGLSKKEAEFIFRTFDVCSVCTTH